MRSIIVAVVATVAIIGAAQAQDLAAKRVAPEIGAAGYNNIAAEERRHAAYPRRPPSQRGSQEEAAKRGPDGAAASREERPRPRPRRAGNRRGWLQHRR